LAWLASAATPALLADAHQDSTEPGASVAIESRTQQTPGSEPAAVLTLDRVVASIGTVAITQSDVERECRLELFLDGKMPSSAADAPALERARDRLVDQKLLRLELSAAPAIQAEAHEAAKKMLAEVRERFPTEQAFHSALGALGMSELQVLERLTEQLLTLKLIDERLRPAAWPEPAEIDAYYRNRFVPDYAQRSSGTPPPLSEVEGQIREILTETRINELLTTWLEELRSVHRVVIHSF